MAHRRKSLSRVLTAALATVLVSVISMLVLAPAAFARVTIVPGSVDGGGTETFAIRLANERSGVPTTRLELTFPIDQPIPFVDVAPADGWTVRVNMRPVQPPVTVGDQVISEAVGSIVWEDGEVGSNQFKQFLVTAGPLPADGRLVLTAEQGYADGTAERWTDPAAPGTPGAPTVVHVPRPAEAPADQPVESASGRVGSAAVPSDVPIVDDAATAEQTDLTLWFLLVAGVLVVTIAVVGYRFVLRRKPTRRSPEKIRAAVEPVRERVGRR
jgi:uncharacterized protein YcnI